MPRVACIQARLENERRALVYLCILLAGAGRFNADLLGIYMKDEGGKLEKKEAAKERVMRGLLPKFVTETSL